MLFPSGKKYNNKRIIERKASGKETVLFQEIHLKAEEE